VLVVNQTAQAIFQAITEKGWTLYYRGPSDAKIFLDETTQKGPVDSLEKGILYLILPKVDNPTDESVLKRFIGKHQLMPRITVPKGGFYNYGRIIYQFGGVASEVLRPLRGSDEVEDYLIPGQEIDFIGIELQEKEVRLLSPRQTFMSYEVFQVAILSLRDISGLD